MHVLALTPDFVLPADRGLRVRELSQLRVMSAVPEVERITLLSLSDAPLPDEPLRSLERTLPKVKVEPPVVRPPRVRQSARTLARFAHLRLLRGEPYLVAQADSDAFRALLERHLSRDRCDVVYLGYLGMVAYLRDVRRAAPRARVVLEEHNVEWRIFDRLADSLGLLGPLARWEARALRACETRSLREVDAVVSISDSDAAGLRELAGIDAIVVPPFVRPGGSRVETTTAPRLGYIGHLGWQPNALGLDWLCRDVWPKVRELLPDAELTIAGPGLPRRADRSLVVPVSWDGPGIRVVGFVEDLEQLYASTIGMIAPVVGGSGVRMKLLETMSAGMPTVTTSDGAAGLGVADGREVLIADRPTEFAERVVRLVRDAPLREGLRAAGYAFLEAHHSEGLAVERLRRALGAGSPT